MKPLYYWIAAGVAILLGVSYCEGRSNARAVATRDSTLAVSAVQTKLAAAEARASHVDTVFATTAAHAATVIRHRADTVWQTLTPQSHAHDSLVVALQVIALQRESLDSLSVAFAAQQRATAHLQTAYDWQVDRGNGLEAALRKMPVGCHRFLGVPFPRIGVGAALTVHGIQPAVAAIVPLGGC